MKVYIIRHGQTNANVNKVYSDDSIDLNENGIKQAKELSLKIKDIDYDLIISSPFKRTIHTAEIINVKDKEIIIDDRLSERDAGDLQGIKLNETDRDGYWNYYKDKSYSNAETVKELFDRVFNFLDKLKEKNYKCVLIVSHSGVSKAFNAYFNGIGDGKFLHKGLKNCEMKDYNL